MPRAKPLSNRQRDLQRKAKPKEGRRLAAVRTAGPPAEPKGAAIASAVREQVKARIRNQVGVAVASGEMTEAEAKRALKVESCQVEGQVFYDPQRRTVRQAAAIRAPGDDGIVALRSSGALTLRLERAALAYRLCYEASGRGLGSCLGSAGEGRRVRDWSELQIAIDKEDGKLVHACSAMELLQRYVMTRLDQLERAVRDASVDGRELRALEEIAGMGRSVREVAGASGHARAATTQALVRALEAIAGVLRITGQ